MDIFLIMKTVLYNNRYASWCGVKLLCIRHVLLDCPVLQNMRQDILKTALLDRNITMENLIGESGAIRSVVTYLREIEIFDEI